MIIGNPITVGGGSGGARDDYGPLFFAYKSMVSSGDGELISPSENAITNVPASAFYKDGSLRKAYLDDCVTVGESAFMGCTNLEKASLSRCVSVGDWAFGYCEHSPATDYTFGRLEYVGDYAFYSATVDCTSRDFTDMFGACTHIGSSAFAFCNVEGGEGLVAACFPSLTYLGDWGFGNDWLMSHYYSVDIGRVTSCYLTDGQFGHSGCFSNLTELSMSCVTSVEGPAFAECKVLGRLDIRACTSVGSGAFQSNPELSLVNAPSLRTVGDHAFEDCPVLTFAQMSALASVGAYAFRLGGDYSPGGGESSAKTEVDLTQLVVQDMFMPSLSVIGSHAFENRSFGEVSLPALASVGAYAFAYGSITTLYLMGPTVPSFASHVFEGCVGPKAVYVPESLYAAYQQTSLASLNLVSA